MGEIALVSISAVLFYAPAFFLQRVVKILEISERDGGRWGDKASEARQWGWVYVVGLIGVSSLSNLGSYGSGPQWFCQAKTHFFQWLVSYGRLRRAHSKFE